MTKNELLDLLRQAENALGVRDLSGIQVTRTADANEASAGISDMTVALHTANDSGGRLALIRAARQRVERGEGGICLDCDEPIPDARLRALPWAEFCCPCQADHEGLCAVLESAGLDPMEAA